MMKKRRKSSKRPCRICRKWFKPDPRVGERQKTCGSQTCQDKWHTKKCAEWNGKNPSYFREIYLSKKLALVESSGTAAKSQPPPTNINRSKSIGQKPLKPSQLPRNLIQEVIGAQQLVIIEYLTQLLLNSFQEEINSQLSKITRELNQLPHKVILRGDSTQLGP